jgi:two-component system, NtrC family, response regulator AtoC
VRTLIVDDDPILAAAAGAAGATVRHVSAPDLEAAVAREAPRLVVLGPAVADRPGLADLLGRLADRPGLSVVVVSARDAAAPAVAALRAGATDYVVLGDDASDLTRAIGRLRERPAAPPRRAPLPVDRRASATLAGLVGESAAIEQVRGLVRTAARTEAHVLIEGETGTGKEVVARAIHALGRRGGGPFVPLNCAAVPETLAESEFFGHTRGAFTGAVQERPGVLQLADRGTLFLDEVEDLSAPLQAKLLRVVQDREVRPLGAASARLVDVRLIAASNRDLAAMVEAGAFRRDLYYRLRVLAIQLPSLRARREDIPLLIEHFVARFNRAHGTSFTVPPATALRPLLEHPWPGNVRELENVLESLLVLASASGAPFADMIAGRQPGATGFTVDERTRILRVLDQHRWNRQRAAAALGISRVTLWRRMERHGIHDPLDAPVGETA